MNKAENAIRKVLSEMLGLTDAELDELLNKTMEELNNDVHGGN